MWSVHDEDKFMTWCCCFVKLSIFFLLFLRLFRASFLNIYSWTVRSNSFFVWLCFSWTVGNIIRFPDSLLSLLMPNACVHEPAMVLMLSSRVTRDNSSMVCMPNVILRSVFKSSEDRLNICHVNAGALSPKIDEFRYIFENVKLDVIVATETWLKSYPTNTSVSLEGFVLLRNDRYAKQSGGIPS